LERHCKLATGGVLPDWYAERTIARLCDGTVCVARVELEPCTEGIAKLTLTVPNDPCFTPAGPVPFPCVTVEPLPLPLPDEFEGTAD